jgi:hypothetical protein
MFEDNVIHSVSRVNFSRFPGPLKQLARLAKPCPVVVPVVIVREAKK